MAMRPYPKFRTRSQTSELGLKHAWQDFHRGIITLGENKRQPPPVFTLTPGSKCGDPDWIMAGTIWAEVAQIHTHYITFHVTWQLIQDFQGLWRPEAWPPPQPACPDGSTNSPQCSLKEACRKIVKGSPAKRCASRACALQKGLSPKQQEKISDGGYKLSGSYSTARS